MGNILVGHRHLYVYLMSPHMIRSPRPPPSIFVYCYPSSSGGGNGLGARL